MPDGQGTVMASNTHIFNNGPEEAAMHPVSRTLLRKWERIRGERNAPLRTDMSIRELSDIVPWVSTLARDTDNLAYTWRLAGTGICETWGRPLTGRPAFADWPTFDRDTIVRGLDTVVGMKQPCVGRFLARSFGGREVGFEFAAVPVVAEQADTEVVQALTTFATFRDRRDLSGDPLVDFEIRRIRILWSDQLPGTPAAVAAAYSSNDVRRINTSFLRVIDGGKA
jgi:hypothetical protein